MKGKNGLRVVLGIIIAGILLALMITFQVRFTETAVLETLGKSGERPLEAGLHARWPWPIQRVIKYDTRMQHFEGIYEQMQTSDGKNVLLSLYVCWRVVDPLLFRTAVGERLADGELYVRQTVRNATLQVIGRYPMSAFASRQKDAVKLEEMEQAIFASAERTAKSAYGIEVLDVGIKRSSLPEDVTEVVMKNMVTERAKLAEDARSQGTAAAEAIVSRADSIAEQVRSFARLKAEQIQAQGSNEAAEYYNRFGEHQDLAIFLRRLRYLSETLHDGLFILDGTQYDVSHGWFGKAPTVEDIQAAPKTPDK